MSVNRDAVLVTGGAGFIGSHTVERLLKRGCSVRVLDNLSSGKRQNLPLDHAGLELMVGDTTNADDVRAAMSGMQRCLHLAAQVSVDRSIQEPAASCKQNILAFVNVLDAARHQGLGRVVYASSAAVYGNPQSLPIDETATLAPISPYGLEKQVNEQYARLFAQLYGLSCFGVRYFNVYGPRQDPASHYAGVISIFVARMQQGKPVTIFGDGSQSRDFIYVGDVARANEAALFSDADGVCNVATGSSITLLDLVRQLEVFAGSSDVHFAAARSGDIRESAASVERMTELLGKRAGTLPEQGLRLLWDACLAEQGQA
ncbi:MAG: NAD-dependent epimerase/dehydratase family protein [Mariprofundaceae bacterium]